MSRYRLHPTPAQQKALLGHCAHARYVWNLAVEQRSWWQPRRRAPGFATQCRQLTEDRAAVPWLAAGSVVVQQQALRDFHAAYASWFAAQAEWRTRTVKLPPEERSAAPSPTGMAQARCERGVPGRRGRPRGRAAAEPPLGRGAGPQARLGQVPLVPPDTGREVLPHHPGSRRPLACRLRGGPAHHPHAWQRRGGRGRPGREGLGGAVDRGAAQDPRAAPDRTAQAAAAGAPQGPPAQGVAPPRADQARRRPAQGQRD